MSIVRNATRLTRFTLPATLGVVYLAGCSLEAPELPSFDTQIRVPISEKRYTFSELVDDIDNIVIDSTEVRIELSGDIDPVGIDDELDVSVEGTSFAAEIGPIDLPDDLGSSVAFDFDELAPPGTPTGDTVVPSFSFNPPMRDAAGIDDFTQVTFASGELVLEITNNMPVPLAGACGALSIVAFDAGTGGEIFTALFANEIAPGETVERRSDLVGVTMGNTVRLLLAGCSPGSSGQTVTVSDTDHVQIDVSFDGVTAESAIAEVPAQSFATSDSSSWDDDMPLSAAAIQSGSAPVTLENTTSLDATVELRFPGFTTPAGDTLGFDLPLPAGTMGSTTLDFAGVTFASATAVTAIPYETRVHTPGSGDVHVAVSSTDEVTVDVGDIELAFDWVEGAPDAIERTFGPFGETLEWPEETDGFRPAVASITIGVTSEIGATATGQITVRATGEADSDTILVNANILPGALGAPVTTTVVINERNSRILDLLAFYPTEIEVSGTFIVGDGASIVRMDRGAEISGTYDVAAPFAFTVEGGEVELDVISLELDEDIRDLLMNNVSGVTMRTSLSNGFPFGASVVVTFSTDSTTVYTSPMVELDELSAASASVDPVSGKTIAPTTSVDLLQLDVDEIHTIAEPEIFVGVDVTFAPSQGVIVMSPDDEVVVRTVLTVDVNVDDGILDGGSDGGGNE